MTQCWRCIGLTLTRRTREDMCTTMFMTGNWMICTVLVLKTFTILSYPILHPTSYIQHHASYIQHPTSSIRYKSLSNPIQSNPILSYPILSYPILSYPILSNKILNIILVLTNIQWSPATVVFISLVIYATKREFTLIDCFRFLKTHLNFFAG